MMTSGTDQDAAGEQIFAMLECLGMKRAGAPVPRFGNILVSALHGCKTCRSVAECREWISSASTTDATAAPGFCLHSELLAEFLAEPLMKEER
jgi:hypothetical protein